MRDPYSVLIIGNFLSSQGRSRSVCEDLAERLPMTGMKVLSASNKLGRIARLCDMLSTVWGRRNEYSVASIDTYSGRAFFWAEAVGSLLSKLGKPFVLTLHGGNLPAFARRNTRRVHRLLNLANVVTAPSRYLLEQMKDYRSDLRLIPNAIDVDKYHFARRDRTKPIFLWLRAFQEIYNASLAIRAVARIACSYPQSRLIMGGGDMGDGSLETAKQLARDLCIASRVEFAGRIPKCRVPGWLQTGDIFLSSASVDNTPVSILEAMACGLCVVSTNVGGIPYLLVNEEDALLVPPDDAEMMATSMHRLLAEPGLSTRLSENARKKAEQFDWRTILPQWEELLRSLCL